jgi:hypothetical protein
VVRDSRSRQKSSFGLAEDKLGLRPECGNAGVVRMEMREEHRLRMNAQTRELRGQIRTRLLPVGHAVNPIEEPHRLGVIAVRWMFREGLIEANQA